MKKAFDVTALGELLIDFTETGFSPAGNALLEANPGGAPCNVLAMLRNLGKTCAFIGMVGRDSFGDLLEDTIREVGIDARGLKRDEEVHTTLAFVHTKAGGERDFSFYRDPGADMNLKKEDLSEELLTGCRIFHFGSLSLTHGGCREATAAAVAKAREAGALISFDPNLREPLWKSLAEAKAQIAWGLGQCDILKISDNELEFMTGLVEYDAGAEMLRKQYPNIRLMIVTAGDNGSYAYYGAFRRYMPIFRVEDACEKTGAGDTFCACVLNYVLEHGLDDLTEADLDDLLRFAAAAASQIIRRKGALKVMPTRAEVECVIGDGSD